MKKNHRFWLLALALSLLLTCAACGKKTVSYAPGNIPTATQEQTTDIRKNDTAETGTTKADGKQDAAKTKDKTADDKKSDEQKPAGEAKKTEEDTKKQEEAKRLEEQKRLEEEKKQQEQAQQPAVPGPDPTPAPDPAPAASVSLYISCATVLNNMDKCSDGVKDIIPADGVILSATVTITEGESVMSVLKRACGDAGIPVSSSGNYVRGINGLFEKMWAGAPAGCTVWGEPSPAMARTAIRSPAARTSSGSTPVIWVQTWAIPTWADKRAAFAALFPHAGLTYPLAAGYNQKVKTSCMQEVIPWTIRCALAIRR